MPEQEHPEPQLKVVDRRKFTTAGERRPGVEGGEEAPPAPAPLPPPPRAAETPKPAAPPPRAEHAEHREVTFSALVDMLYGNTLMFLGLAAPPGEQPRLELEGARETIDMLAMLQTKTRGNLSPEESETLANVLYDLRMAFMEVTKAAAGARVPQPVRRR